MPRSLKLSFPTKCLSVILTVEDHLLDLDVDGNIN